MPGERKARVEPAQKPRWVCRGQPFWTYEEVVAHVARMLAILKSGRQPEEEPWTT